MKQPQPLRLNDFAAGTEEAFEFQSLVSQLYPELTEIPLGIEFRLRLNELTGTEVPNGSGGECIRGWLPRLRELAA